MLRPLPLLAALVTGVATLLGMRVAPVSVLTMSSAARPLAIIGRGCDPVRARFAEKHWSVCLGVEVQAATSDEELFRKMEGKRFDLFFMAPGACARTRAGVYLGGDVVERVKELQPGIKVVYMDDVESGLSLISGALGLAPAADVKTRTEDWPFVD